MKRIAAFLKKNHPLRKLRQMRHLLIIFNVKTIIVTLLSIVSTYLCHRFYLIADFPLTLIATAVVFPIVFAINGAYQRRENALREYGNMTPRTLNAFSGFFITILPVLYGPYFASLAQDISPLLLFVTPILFSVILVSLDNIQQHPENPFDQIGEDDIVINAEKFEERLDLQ